MAFPWEKLLTIYGPLALGWVAFFGMFIHYLRTMASHQSVYQDLTEKMTVALLDSAVAAEKLTTVISERLRPRGDG